MSTTDELHSPLSVPQAVQLLELAQSAVGSAELADMAQTVLPGIVTLTGADAAILYVADVRLHKPHLFSHQMEQATVEILEKLCAEQLNLISGWTDGQPIIVSNDLRLYPLGDADRCMALLGVMLADKLPVAPRVWTQFLLLLTNVLSRLIEQRQTAQELQHLNAYMTVSSMLTQSMALHELLEIALYSCMELVGAEAASVLLLDDEKANLNFYQVEGVSKPVLMRMVFPAGEGIAGAVLGSQEAEIINDVRSDPRFYGHFDSDTGFLTLNMIAVPLLAGDEKIGVLEVLNKVDGKGFKEEEKLLLLTLAEEIAFAIRNAMVFEYVADTYCIQRQGQNTCKGCERPLGSWTPCVKYREAMV